MIWTVGEIMTPDPMVVRESDSVQHAAHLMADHGVGFLPVSHQSGELVGVLTDRDIVLRCTADGDRAAAIHVGAICVRRPVVVDPDDLLDEALLVMVNHQVRRLPVVRHRRLVGVLALADIALAADPIYVGEALRGISLVPGRVRRSG